MKNFFFIIAAMLLLVSWSLARAADRPGSVESDFARAIRLGQEEVKNDPEAKRSQQEVDDAEDPHAREDGQPVTVEETPAPQEIVETAEELLLTPVEETVIPEPSPEESPTP